MYIHVISSFSGRQTKSGWRVPPFILASLLFQHVKNREFLTGLTIVNGRNTLFRTCRSTSLRGNRQLRLVIVTGCGEKRKGGIPPHIATMPPQIHHITDVPTEHGILSASAASILAWLHPLSRLPGRIFATIHTCGYDLAFTNMYVHSDRSVPVTPAAFGRRRQGLCLPYSSGGCSGFEPDSLSGSEEHCRCFSISLTIGIIAYLPADIGNYFA